MIITTGTSQRFFSEQVNMYFERSFCDLIDDHLMWLADRSGTNSMEVTVTEAIKYQGDLYGLLLEKGIPPILHFSAMRLSGFLSPDEFSKDSRQINVPTDRDIKDLMSRYKRTS